jgi:serine/threonine protein kinase
MNSYNLLNNLTNKGILEFNNIKQGKKIGEGGFGTVFEGYYKTLPIAIKEIRESSSDYETLKELKILKSLNHPKIPCFYGFAKPDRVIIERIYGITLQKMTQTYKDIPDIIKIKILLDFLDALLFVHSNNIIHRDLKPNNIMINLNFEAKLLDFGISKLADKTKTTMNPRAGTTIYFSPEYVQTRGDLNSIVISKKTDIWAVGLIINEVFSGELPWSHLGMFNSYQVLVYLMEKIEFQPGKSIKDENIINLIRLCTQYDKNDRYDTVNVLLHLLILLFLMIKENKLETLINMKNLSSKSSKSMY